MAHLAPPLGARGALGTRPPAAPLGSGTIQQRAQGARALQRRGAWQSHHLRLRRARRGRRRCVVARRRQRGPVLAHRVGEELREGEWQHERLRAHPERAARAARRQQ
eukprot:5579658-Prymnesium_polylepis.2